MNKKIYPGFEEDLKNGMTPTAKIILDAKVFGLIGDDESCKGWNVAGVQALYDKVSRAWEPFGLLPSQLPDDLRARHTQFYGHAVQIAKDHGWNPDDCFDDIN